LAKVGGNPDLKPEEGDTLTVGVAYSPDFIRIRFNFRLLGC
jgi:outer membrane receptor protein involved in Fe transport